MIEEILSKDIHVKTPLRFFIQKLLQMDDYSIKNLKKSCEEVNLNPENLLSLIESKKNELEKMHGHDISTGTGVIYCPG